MRHRFFVWGIVCFTLWLGNTFKPALIHAQPVPTLGHTQTPAPFIMALAMDRQGRVWVGSEDAGVWRYDATAPENARWTQFTIKDGLGDDNGYALTCDHQGRIWCGHLNHGVSVWNGQIWRSYDVLNGPIGERVFALATCPIDGDVWMGTSAGLTRYSAGKDTWTNYTRADGLPADQISALCFDKEGTLFVGTDCDGLAIGAPADNYQTWRNVRGPDVTPTTPSGKGLPSNLINDILVAHNGTIYVATTCGLARSHDGGKSWDYGRGQDWADKVQGLATGPPPGWQFQTGAQLTEDYVTRLAEDGAGMLWVGHWRQGFEIYDPRSGQQVYKSTVDAAGRRDFVRAILPLPGSGPFIGWYGGGITQADRHFDTRAAARHQSAGASGGAALTGELPHLPTPAQAPTITELQMRLQQVQALRQPLAVGSGAYLGADWRTWGDWMGRYGREFALLCYEPSRSYGLGFFARVSADFGTHHAQGDFLHRLTYTMQTDDPKALYDLLPDARRIGQWNDHGEAYPLLHEGPDLWVMAEVPPGEHRVTIRFFNYEEHEGNKRFCDYLLELKPYTPKLAEADALPTLARARVRDCSAPVYQQFAVHGPGKFYIKVNRNYSFNAALDAIMLDDLIIPPAPNDSAYRAADPWELAFMGGARYAPPDPDAPVPTDPHLLEKILAGTLPVAVPPTAAEQERAKTIATARQLWRTLDNSYDWADGAPLQWLYRVEAYRAAARANAPVALLANWRWFLRWWLPEDRQEWKEGMRQARATWIKKYPDMKNHRF